MKQSMVFIFVVVFIGYQVAGAEQTQSPWLIGRWDGNIERFTGQGGSARMLRVNNISVEGHDSQPVGKFLLRGGEGLRSRWMAHRLRSLCHPQKIQWN
jgi:hypothetical protein